ncbi:MAG TPA: hypothetical protein VHU18_03560 [Rhizomicrobium sp.]|jgi:uncharacterized membrane protein|nr:hypothetical protein [Rhizomicrobium sp.]
MLLIKQGLPTNYGTTAEYITSWKRLLDANEVESSHELQRRLFDHLYGNLDVLDNKTNSLIQLTAILVAAYAFVVALPALRGDPLARSFFVLGVVYAAVAVLLCLRVIWVHWSSRDDLENAEKHMKSLLNVRTRRTLRFRRAWTFTAISLLSLAIILLDMTVMKFPLVLARLIPYFIIGHLLVIYVYDEVVIRITRPKFDSNSSG